MLEDWSSKGTEVEVVDGMLQQICWPMDATLFPGDRMGRRLREGMMVGEGWVQQRKGSSSRSSRRSSSSRLEVNGDASLCADW